MSRIKDQGYLKEIRLMPCLICGGRAIAHHLMHAEPSAMSLRSGDNWACPLCPVHHHELHMFGDEPDWWLLQGIDPIAWCQEIYQQWLSRHTATTKPIAS